MRKEFIKAVGIAAVLLLACAVLPQRSYAAYPERPIHVVVPLAAGQGMDTVIRMLMAEVSKRVGQPIVVENRQGGNGLIAIDAVKRAAPDGYTILGMSSSFLVNPVILKGPLPYDLQRDFIPILRVVDSGIVLVAHPSVTVKTLADFLNLAKQEQRLPVGTGGNATTMHLTLEVLKSRSGAPLENIAYRGDPATLTDVMGGHIKFGFSGFAAALPHIRSGSLRPIAVSTAARIDPLPDVPTIAESGFPGFEMIGWLCFLAPAGTPPAVIDKLYTAIRAASQVKEIKDKAANLAMMVVASPQTPAEFKSYFFEAEKNIGNIARAANIKPE